MENLPENNNVTSDEFSTVFSAPVDHKDTVGKNKKRGKTVFSLFLVLLVLVGATFAVVKFIPEREEEDNSIGTIEVVSLDTDDIGEMTVENKNGKFGFYSKEVKSTSKETGEEITNIEWYLKGYDAEMIDGGLISDVVDKVVDIDAIREITEKTLEDCGLSKPVVSASFKTTDKAEDTVYIGAKSPDNAGVYVKLKSDDKIYLVGSDLDESLSFTDLDLASTEQQKAVMLPEKYSEYCNGVAVEKSDYVTVEGVNFPEKMVFRPTSDERIAMFTPYEVIEPTKRSASNVETMFLVFTGGFNVSGAYSYDVKDDTLKKLGFDKPDFVLSAVFDDYTYSYKFKQQEDGDFAVIGNDSKYVKKVALSDCGFLSYTTTDLYNPTIFMASIDDVSNLTIKTQDSTYSFDIAQNPQGDDTNKYSVKMGDKTFKSTYFQAFWQYLCMLQAIDYNTSNITAKKELTIVYTYTDENIKPTEISFRKESAVRYQYSIDGVPMGKIGSSDYTKVLKNLERLLDGKQVVVN